MYSGWEEDPWSGEVKDGEVYGRGSVRERWRGIWRFLLFHFIDGSDLGARCILILE